MRVGIMTGGGSCPGLNAVIRAAIVRTARTCDCVGRGLRAAGLGRSSTARAASISTPSRVSFG